MTTFKPSRAFRLANRMVAPMVRSGLPIGARRTPMALLTVTGRRSGIARTTPVALAPHHEGWLLVAVYGASDWSRNLEAAGEGTVTVRGKTTAIVARRLEPQEAGPILRESISTAPAMVRRMTAPYFSAGEDSPSEEWEAEAVKHPVFVLSPA